MKVLITGASSGIGEEMAYYLSKLGYDLILVARNEEKLKEIKNKIKNNVEIISTDLTKKENCLKLHNQVNDIDILINNAGFGLFGEFSNTDLEKEIEMINLNIISVQILTKLYLKDFIKKDKGQILNVASIAGFLPGPLMTTYYASKNYVIRLSEGIREELRKNRSHVKISVLCPGPVKTIFDNIAGVTFSLKGQNSSYVAKYTIDKMLNNKFIIIPGLKIKILRIFSKIVPDAILVKFVYRTQRKKDKI